MHFLVSPPSALQLKGERKNMERKWRRQDKVTTCLLCQTDLMQTVTSEHLTLDLVWFARCAPSLAHFSPPTLAALMNGNFSDTWLGHYSHFLQREISVGSYQVFWQTLVYAFYLLINNNEVNLEAEVSLVIYFFRAEFVLQPIIKV